LSFVSFSSFKFAVFVTHHLQPILEHGIVFRTMQTPLL